MLEATRPAKPTRTAIQQKSRYQLQDTALKIEIPQISSQAHHQKLSGVPTEQKIHY